jgi:hypothetical protein
MTHMIVTFERDEQTPSEATNGHVDQLKMVAGLIKNAQSPTYGRNVKVACQYNPKLSLRRMAVAPLLVKLAHDRLIPMPESKYCFNGIVTLSHPKIVIIENVGEKAVNVDIQSQLSHDGQFWFITMANKGSSVGDPEKINTAIRQYEVSAELVCYNGSLSGLPLEPHP